MEHGVKRIKKRNWRGEEVSLLLELWEQRISALRSKKKNGRIHAEIACQMAANGYQFSAIDVRMKIHNLTTKYRAEKKNVGVSGGSPSTWVYYGKINSFLGGFKSFNLDEMVHQSSQGTSEIKNELADHPENSFLHERRESEELVLKYECYEDETAADNSNENQVTGESWEPTEVPHLKSKSLCIAGNRKRALESEEESYVDETTADKSNEHHDNRGSWNPTDSPQFKSKPLRIAAKRKRGLEEVKIELILSQKKFYEEENRRAEEKHQEELKEIRLRNKLLEIELEKKQRDSEKS